MIVSSLYPRFRDIGIIWSGVRRRRCSTPRRSCTRSSAVATARTRSPQLIAMNPLTPMFELARVWIIDPDAPYPGSAAAGGPLRLAVSVSITLAIVRPRGLGVQAGSAADRRGAVSALVARPLIGERQQRAGEHHRDQRHRRHLPVPVERRVERRRRRTRRSGPAASAGAARNAPRGRQRDADEERRKQREADDPELGERLQRQRVSVLRELVDRAVAQPVHRPAAGADAAQRLGRGTPAPPRASTRSGCSEASPAGSRRR